MKTPGTKTILDVDDDAQFSRSSCEQLEEAGFRTLPMFDGPMAQRAIRQHNFDLVLFTRS